jgi:hypothetical protein
VEWWRDRQRRNRVALIVFAFLGVGSIVLAGSLQWAEGDRRVVVVTMQTGAGEPARQLVKDRCGDLPGVSVVPDQGNPSARIQGRFPVRLKIAGATVRQEAALHACLAEQGDVVRGFITEGTD